MSSDLNMRIAVDADCLPDALRQLNELVHAVEGALINTTSKEALNELLAQRRQPPAANDDDPEDCDSNRRITPPE